MILIRNENVIYNLSSENKPACFCEDGDTVVFNTLDCFSNILLPKGTKLGVDNPKTSNPHFGN
ncbi:MAG: hypothetical protein EWM47_09415 [Anaerolineaceae bacterium]|nr:MAG: hypothetical protein EWM47_09415 [Anaerolineaceae bacterium]